VGCADVIGADFDVSLAPDAGAAQWFANDQPFAWAVAVDEQSVYWSTAGNSTCTQGKILKRDKAGGPIVALAPAAGCPTRIALDVGHVYWTDSREGGGIYRIAKDAPEGTPPELLAGNQNAAVGIAVDATYVYWAAAPRVWRLRLDAEGGSATPEALDRDGDQVICGPPPAAEDASIAQAGFVRVDDEWAFTTEPTTNGRVWKLSLEHLFNPCVLARDMATPLGLAVAGDWVFFTTFDAEDGGIWQVSRNGVGAHELVPHQRGPADLTTDDLYYYWTSVTDGTIRRGWINPPPRVEVLAEGETNVNSLAVDATHVYWTIYATDGGVRFAPKPP
jgi:hypothetical protein